MQSTFCVNCGEPLVANAAFCPNCGKKVEPPSPDQQATQLHPPPPPPSALNPTMRASAPPAGDVPPAYGGAPTALGAPPGADPYASQYAAPPPPSSFSQYSGPPPASGPQNHYAPSVYAPGPPPPVTPGGVAPWAQPQKRQGRRNIFVAVLVLIVLVGACGGGLYLLLHKPSRPSTSTGTSQTPGTGSTPGTGNTPGSGTTGGGGGATQTLDINRQAIYAGIVIKVTSVTQVQDNADYANRNPDQDVLLIIGGSLDNEAPRPNTISMPAYVVTPNGVKIDRGIGHGNSGDELPTLVNTGTNQIGHWYFEVPKNIKLSDWKLVFADTNAEPVVIPFTGAYDPSIYQEVPHTMGLNQPIKFHNGDITGVITKIITATWNPGYQAPKGMRFVRVYFHVTNNTPVGVNVGDGSPPQYVLVYPNGDRLQADTQYNEAINAIVNGAESKDVGFDEWVIPQTPAPYTMVFLNPDGSTAGTVDFGTI